LAAGNAADFVRRRKRLLTEVVESLGDRLAGWARADRDRPSINYLLGEK
jgi:hypothetical protein